MCAARFMFWTIGLHGVKDHRKVHISFASEGRNGTKRGKLGKPERVCGRAWKKDADRITTVLNRLLNSCSRWKLNGKV